jgi:hypothetical protein
MYRVSINYWRILLHHNLSRKCHKIVKFMLITHSEHNIWNGPIVAAVISGKGINQRWREIAASLTEHSWCVLEFAWCNSFVAVQRAFRQQFACRGHFMKLQMFIFLMVVTSCISVQFLWKYGFGKSPDNLHAPCSIHYRYTMNITCNFLYCKHQMHKHFFLSLCISFWHTNFLAN